MYLEPPLSQSQGSSHNVHNHHNAQNLTHDNMAQSMVYTRPSTLPLPTIWHRFTTRGMKLRIQDITEDQVEPAVQLLAKYFTADEPPCKYIEIHKYPSAQAELEKLWRDTIQDKLSVVCVEDTDEPTDIIGVNVLTVVSKHDKEEAFKTDDKIWAQLFGAVDLVSRSVDIYTKFDVDQYLTAYGLVVDPKWRGCGIGKEILLARHFDDIILFVVEIDEKINIYLEKIFDIDILEDFKEEYAINEANKELRDFERVITEIIDKEDEEGEKGLKEDPEIDANNEVLVMMMRAKRKCICDTKKQLQQITGNPGPLSSTEINKIRLNLFTERNSDGTCNLILKGKDVFDKYNKRINDDDIRAIVLYITGHPKRITKLDVSYNEVTDAGFFKLLKKILIKGRSSVVNLNIMNNNLTDKSAANLAKFAKFIKLKYLRVNGNDIANDGNDIGEFLLNNKSLVYFDIGETGQTLTSVAKIVGVLNDCGGNDNLKVLDVSRVVPFNETKWLAYHVEHLLAKNTTVVELHLQKNEFVGHDVEYIVRGLRLNDSLLYLDLGYNRIGDYGAELIGNYLKDSPGLILINLAGNGIRDGGARALSFGLPYSKIRALDMGNNKLTDDGILDILNSLKKVYYLRFLNLWGNEIGHRSCVVIERMLKSGALFQHTVDIKIYEVDKILYAAYYPNPADRNKHLYYNELEFAHAQPIYHIKRNVLPEAKIVKVECKQRRKLDKTDKDNF